MYRTLLGYASARATATRPRGRLGFREVSSDHYIDFGLAVVIATVCFVSVYLNIAACVCVCE